MLYIISIIFTLLFSILCTGIFIYSIIFHFLVFLILFTFGLLYLKLIPVALICLIPVMYITARDLIEFPTSSRDLFANLILVNNLESSLNMQVHNGTEYTSLPNDN